MSVCVCACAPNARRGQDHFVAEALDPRFDVAVTQSRVQVLHCLPLLAHCVCMSVCLCKCGWAWVWVKSGLEEERQRETASEIDGKMRRRERFGLQ